MKPHALLILVLPVVSLFTGCAFTKTPVALDFKPKDLGEKVNVDTTLAVKKLTDARGVDAHLLANKGIAGKTSGIYYTTNEVANIVTVALRDSLASLNYKLLADGADLTITGDILKFDSVPIMGFWSGQMEGTIQLNMKLLDGKSGALVWSEIISGGFKKTGLQIDHEGHRKMVAEATLQDAMKKLAQSETFKTAVKNHRVKQASIN